MEKIKTNCFKLFTFSAGTACVSLSPAPPDRCYKYVHFLNSTTESFFHHYHQHEISRSLRPPGPKRWNPWDPWNPTGLPLIPQKTSWHHASSSLHLISKNFLLRRRRKAPANLGEVTRVDAHRKVDPHKGGCKQNINLGGWWCWWIFNIHFEWWSILMNI